MAPYSEVTPGGVVTTSLVPSVPIYTFSSLLVSFFYSGRLALNCDPANRASMR